MRTGVRASGASSVSSVAAGVLVTVSHFAGVVGLSGDAPCHKRSDVSANIEAVARRKRPAKRVNACAHVSEASSLPPWAWVRQDRYLGGQESGRNPGCVCMSERVGAACFATWAELLLLVAAAAFVTTQPVGACQGGGYMFGQTHVHAYVQVMECSSTTHIGRCSCPCTCSSAWASAGMHAATWCTSWMSCQRKRPSSALATRVQVHIQVPMCVRMHTCM
jgi:hypothetical protein